MILGGRRVRDPGAMNLITVADVISKLRTAFEQQSSVANLDHNTVTGLV